VHLRKRRVDSGEWYARQSRATDTGTWSAFVKKRGRTGKKPGPPVQDDLCTVTDEDGRARHVFAASGANQLWLTDITDVFGNKIVGYSIESRMKSNLVVNALNNAVAMRGDVAGSVVTAVEDLNFETGSSSALWPVINWSDPS